MKKVLKGIIYIFILVIFGLLVGWIVGWAIQANNNVYSYKEYNTHFEEPYNEIKNIQALIDKYKDNDNIVITTNDRRINDNDVIKVFQDNGYKLVMCEDNYYMWFSRDNDINTIK